MELLGKAADAASMFWQALDDRERMLIVYAGAWLVAMLVVGARKRDREALRREIVEELNGARETTR